jgi:hypothetical protein
MNTIPQLTTSALKARPWRRTLALALSCCVALLAYAAPNAFAGDFCVNSAQCGPANTLPDLQTALDAAVFNDSPDRVFVGPGTYTAANGYSYDGSIGGDNSLELIGAGRDATKLVSTTQHSTVLRLVGAKVRDLTLEGPQGDTGDAALALDDSLAQNVSVLAQDTGVVLANGATLEDSKVTAPILGVRTFGTASVNRSAIDSGGPAVYAPTGDVSVANSSLSGRSGLNIEGGNGHVHDTLIRVKPPLDNASGEVTGGIVADASSGQHVLSATNVTVVGDGQPGEFTAVAEGRNVGTSVTIALENVIGVATPNRFYRRGFNGGAATITARHSDLPAAPDRALGGTGSLDLSEDNVSVDPRFVDPAGDFHLAADSPLLDRGTATPAGGLGATDLDGNARVADGDGDGSAAPDMGAFERPEPGSQPTPGGEGTSDASGSTPTGQTDLAPVLSRLAVTPRKFVLGARSARRGGFRFALSEPARVTIKIQRLRLGRKRTVGRIARTGRAGANRMAFSGRLHKRKLKPGRYLASAVAVDTAGQRSSARRVRFTVASR